MPQIVLVELLLLILLVAGMILFRPRVAVSVSGPDAKPPAAKALTLDRISDSVISLDREWRYTFLNEAALQTNPRGREACMGKVIWQVHPHLKDTPFYEKAKMAIATRKVVETEMFYEPLDSWFAVRLYPSEDGLTIIRRDISQQKRALLTMDAERKLSDSIINSLPGVFYLFNKEGQFLRWNQNFERVSGYNAEEIRRMKPADFICASGRRVVVEKIESVLREGEDAVQLDILPKSGRPITYFFSGKAVVYNGEACLLGVGVDFTEKIEAQEQMQRTSDHLRELTSHLQQIVEEERAAIARDIHDDLGQQLTAIKIALYSVEQQLEGDPEVADAVGQIIEMAGAGIESIRNIANRLRPPALDVLGLVEAMQWQVQEFERLFSIPVSTEFSKAYDPHDPEVATNLFRIFQEALTNIARHASATRVDVKLQSEGSNLVLEIGDNGRGLDPEINPRHRLGLLGMKERTFSMGGHFSFKSEPGRGTLLKVEIPLANDQF